MTATEQALDWCHWLASRRVTINQDEMRELFIKGISSVGVNLAEHLKLIAVQSADDMEGADFKEFFLAESRMVMAIELLEYLGVKFDPIEGKEEILKKPCIKCFAVKPIYEFYFFGKGEKRHRFNTCKTCKDAASRRSRYGSAKSRKKYLEYLRNDYQVNKSQYQARSKARPKGKIKPPNPQHQSARSALKRAVKTGKIQKPKACSACKKPVPQNKLHGHHADYSKPLKVKWLCSACHGVAHRTL